MVSLRNIATAIAALSATALCQSTPSQATAESITILNGPLIVAGQGPFPTLIRGDVDIVSTVTTQISQMQGMAPVPAGADADAINTAFRNFARVREQFQNTLTSKAGLFETLPFIGQPVTAVQRQIEDVVDTLAFQLIDTVQSRASDLQDRAGSLSNTIRQTIDAYSGITTSKRDLGVEGKVANIMVA